MVWVRKNQPGADSFGHTWERAGDVVEMPADEALQLLAIRDGGFSEGTPPDGADDGDTDAGDDQGDDDSGDTAEPESTVEPEQTEVDEAPKRRGRPRKNPTDTGTVEE